MKQFLELGRPLARILPASLRPTARRWVRGIGRVAGNPELRQEAATRRILELGVLDVAAYAAQAGLDPRDARGCASHFIAAGPTRRCPGNWLFDGSSYL